MKKKPKRTQVSLKGPIYERLKAEAKRRGVSVPTLLEEILGGGPALKPPQVH